VFGFSPGADGGLDPGMVKAVFPDIATAAAAKRENMATLQLMVSNGFEADLEPLSAAEIARRNTGAILALNAQLGMQEKLDAIKGGPHAHGNLEALLNIAAGLCLCFIAVAPLFKQIISGCSCSAPCAFGHVSIWRSCLNPVGRAGAGDGHRSVLLLAALLLTGIAAAIEDFAGNRWNGSYCPSIHPFILRMNVSSAEIGYI
jgi:hypothetical protein